MGAEKRFLFWTTNINKDNRYCDVKGKICNFLNKFLRETLFPHSSIIIIAFYCILKIVELGYEFPHNVISVTQSSVKESMINYFNEEADMYVLAFLII
jgi:hypothetical protein